MIKSSLVALFVLLSSGLTQTDVPSHVGRIGEAGEGRLQINLGERRDLRLTFADEFDAFTPYDGKTGVWKTHYWFDGPETFGGRSMPHQGEEQLYMDPGYAGTGDKPLGINPFGVRDGVLAITAERAAPELQPLIHGYKYTSGIITTKDRFEQRYGYFEIRAKLPAGKGLWPAFWLVPGDRSWPPEIDIFEVLGQEPDTLYATLHFMKDDKHESSGVTLKVADVSRDFHTYGVAWSPETMRFFIDRREVAAGPTPDTMHRPMYVIANLGVGGNWPGSPDESTPFPARMEIDYIRVYQFQPEPKAPKGKY